MVSAIVRKAHLRHNKLICVGDGRDIRVGDTANDTNVGQVFLHNPRIAREVYPGAVWVQNIMGQRPYIDYLKTTPERVVYNQMFHVEPGELYLTDDEKAKYDLGDFIYIEPNTKGTFGGNKDWGFDKWQEVAKLDLPFVQGSGRKLDGVRQVETRSFRDACALLSRALFFVGTDGGLHHAAAALGKRAVVVWGGLVSPKILGYASHVNLHSGTHSCGTTTACKHCRQALDWVTVDMVKDAVHSLA